MAISTKEKTSKPLVDLNPDLSRHALSQSLSDKHAKKKSQIAFNVEESGEFQLSETGRPYGPGEKDWSDAVTKVEWASFYGIQLPFPEHPKVRSERPRDTYGLSEKFGEPEGAVRDTVDVASEIALEQADKVAEATVRNLAHLGEVTLYQAVETGGQVLNEMGAMLFGGSQEGSLESKRAEDKKKSEAGIAESRAKVAAIKRQEAETQALSAQREEAYLVNELASAGLSVEDYTKAAGGNQAQDKRRLLNINSVRQVMKFIKSTTSKARELVTGKKAMESEERVQHMMADIKSGNETAATANAGG